MGVCIILIGQFVHALIMHTHDAGNLVGLNFTSMNLTCTLPSTQLSTFTALESLILSDNPNLRVSTLGLLEVQVSCMHCARTPGSGWHLAIGSMVLHASLPLAALA